jgi:hypothetical protein
LERTRQYAGKLSKNPSNILSSIYADYDALQLMQGRKYAESFPVDPNDLLGSNYYDLAYTLYQIYYRIGDTYWRDKARTVATAWRDGVNNQAVVKYMNGDWGAGPAVPPSRSLATLGLAVLAVENNDAQARAMVKLHSDLELYRLSTYRGDEAWLPGGDARESGYMLMNFIAATVVGYDHRTDARRLLDIILAHQQTDGHWNNYSKDVPSDCSNNGYGAFVLHYMTGLLMEGLIMYDQVFGDPRILPAIEKSVAWTWQNGWVPTAKAFNYADVNCGSVGAYPTSNLTGLIIPAWGYAYAKTHHDVYKTQGDQILKGFVEQGVPAIYGVKQFSQMFRSSPKYLGYIAVAR